MLKTLQYVKIIICHVMKLKKCMALVFIFVQLTIAKVHSEKRIHSLGGIDYKSYETTEDSDKSGAPSTKVSIYLMQLERCFLFVMKFGL